MEYEPKKFVSVAWPAVMGAAQQNVTRPRKHLIRNVDPLAYEYIDEQA
jgi:hypothetical protein